MLNIFFGDMPEAIYNPVVYFKNRYTDDWITDDLSREMILDVDKSTVVSARIIDSPVLGAITPRELSGGVKTLMDIYKVPSEVFNASACGDNCAKWILKIADLEDITINLRHIMVFGDGEFTAHILNTNQTVHSIHARNDPNRRNDREINSRIRCHCHDNRHDADHKDHGDGDQGCAKEGGDNSSEDQPEYKSDDRAENLSDGTEQEPCKTEKAYNNKQDNKKCQHLSLSLLRTKRHREIAALHFCRNRLLSKQKITDQRAVKDHPCTTGAPIIAFCPDL